MKTIALLLAIPLAPLSLMAQTTPVTSRTVQYHSQDIVPIKAKLKYTTLIQVPPSEKIMEAATGDKDFWIVDIVGSFCFVHPARERESAPTSTSSPTRATSTASPSADVTESGLQPDLKVIVVPVDASNIVASQGSPQYVPAAQLHQVQGQLANLQQHVESTVDEYKSAYQTQLRFDYAFEANKGPFNIQTIYHDDKFTYIKTTAPEKFSVYEMRDGKPNLINYDLRDGTYIIPKVMDNGYVELGKKKMEFSKRKG